MATLLTYLVSEMISINKWYGCGVFIAVEIIGAFLAFFVKENID